MIEIKTIFSDWKEVDKERAKNYVLWLKSSLQNVKDDEKIPYIEKYILRGIKVLELCPDFNKR